MKAKKQKRPVGRPRKRSRAGRKPIITPEVVNKLEQAFSMGCTDLEACIFADISRQTLYNYQEKNPEFMDRKAMLKKKLVFKARTVVAAKLNAGDVNTAKWYLERKARNEFGEIREREAESDNNGILEALLKANLDIQKNNDKRKTK